MPKSPFESQSASEREPALHAEIDLMDLRAGHWPGAKTPPWLFNESWAMKHPEWKKAVEAMAWTDSDEIKIGTGLVKISPEDVAVDIYARRDPRRGSDYFAFAAYPKGTAFKDHWGA